MESDFLPPAPTRSRCPAALVLRGICFLFCNGVCTRKLLLLLLPLQRVLVRVLLRVLLLPLFLLCNDACCR